MHVSRDNEQPMMYASRSLCAAESKYAQIEREVLAINFAVKTFHQYLYGKEFVLVTNHKPEMLFHLTYNLGCWKNYMRGI